MGNEKKRKRQEQNGERPVKKAAVPQAEGNVRVQYIDNDDVPGPIIGTIDSPKLQLDTGS